MSRDEAPALRPVLLVIGAMFAFSLMEATSFLVASEIKHFTSLIRWEDTWS